MKALRTLRRAVLMAQGLIALSGCPAYAGGELAANTQTSYDLPADRVRAAVHLYLEGAGQEQIAAPMLVKLGKVGKTELLSMKQSAGDSEEAAAITEILQVYFEPPKASEPERVATVKAQPPVKNRRVAVQKTTSPAPKQKIAELISPMRRTGPLKIHISVMGLTNPLQPSATRF